MNKNFLNKISKIGILGLALSMVMVSVSCGNADSEKEKDSKKEASDSFDGELEELSDEQVDDLRVSTAEFSIEVFKSAYESDDFNTLISPLSIECALGMTANGADGETLDDMEDVLAGGMDLKYYNAYMKSIQPNDEVLSVANSIWIRGDKDQIDISDDFLAINKYVYDAEAFIEGFNQTTVDKINDWVSDNTNGMIDHLIDNIYDDEVVFLINAAAFEGKWKEEYSKDKIFNNQTFTNLDGSESTVTMLSSEEKIYFEDEDATGFLKYYDGGRYAFMAILPNEDITLDRYIESLDGRQFVKMYDNAKKYDVYARIPEFTYDYDITLNDGLIDMGMGEAFEPSADFSKMGKTDTGELFISKVYHKTYISLDRNGTKAAAVTEVSMTKNCAEVEDDAKYVFLDRPFMYAIMDTETGLPIFIGAVKYL